MTNTGWVVATFIAVAAAHAQQASSEWSVSDRPLVSIGDNGADTLILRAYSAVRLSNGTIVVASYRDSKLQWFDARGRHLRTVGRRGQGPHEFGGGSIHLYARAGDTVVVHDVRNRRYHHLNAAGDFVRIDTLGDAWREAWAYNRTVVYRIPGNVDRATLGQVLGRVAGNQRDTVRRALADAAGNIWIESPADRRTFTIYTAGGRQAGTLTFPPRFTPYQILDSLVLGHWTDEDDIEYIQLRRLTRRPTPAPPARPTPAGYDQATELRVHRDLIRRMESALRGMITAQEAYFSDHIKYATTMAQLTGHTRFAPPPGFRFTLLGARESSYVVLVEHPDTPVTCVAILRPESPPRPGSLANCG